MRMSDGGIQKQVEEKEGRASLWQTRYGMLLADCCPSTTVSHCPSLQAIFLFANSTDVNALKC